MRLMAFLLLLTLTLAGCGRSRDGSSAFAPRTAEPVPDGIEGVTSFAQTVPDEDGFGEVFPAQANTWDLDRDFALAAGYGAQFASALELFTGNPTAPVSHASLTVDVFSGALASFPYDQDFAEVAFLTPLFRAADGVRTAAVSDGASIGIPRLSGERSGYLNGTADSRLSRTLDLPAAGGPYTLAWTDQVSPSAGALLGGVGPSYRVVLRDPATGSVVFDACPACEVDGTPRSRPAVEIPPTAPEQVVLSFELRSAAGGYAAVDDVVLTGNAGPVPLENGDFEALDLASRATLAPWQANDPREAQNVRSGFRDVVPAGGPTLQVTRTFYAPPAERWARMVDVFENPGVTAVSTTVVYRTILGGSSPLAVVRGGGRAVVAWDAFADARDVGFVQGNGAAFVDDGSPFVFLVHSLTVPAGGKVALVHFVVQLGRTEGGPTPADVPQGVDAECAAIAAGFRTDTRYANDLEAGQLAAIQNL